MPDPITTSIAAIAAAKFVGYSIGSHVLGGEAHHFYREFLERWRESPIDPATGQPRNHDLQRASLNALREAALVVVMELAGRLDPKKPWLPRIIEHVRAGKLFRIPLFEAGHDARRQWVETLRTAVAGERFEHLHDMLLLSENDVRDCFAGGDLCAALEPRLAAGFLEWARREVQTGTEPTDFASLVQDGWTLGGSNTQRATLAHAYCLFFREHLKRTPAVFRILVTDTLNDMHGNLAGLGANLTAEVKGLRESLANLVPGKFAALRLDFTDLEQWLEPQLGEIKGLLGNVATELESLAVQQGEILVAIVTLNTEVRRGNQDAIAIIGDLRAWLEQRLDDLPNDVAKKVADTLKPLLAARGKTLADLSQEELEREFAKRVPDFTEEDLHRLIGYARFKADISRMIKYAPERLIGRESETKFLKDAWARVRRGTKKRPHLLTFVALGGEGKTSLVAKWAAELAHQDWPGCDAVFAWSFYSQGTREQMAASSDLFLKEALTFFGDDADKQFAASPAGAYEKGQRLARIVGQRRSLLILDGLEPLQYAPTSPTPGQLKDHGIAALLKGLAQNSHGLCVVTTRYSLPDLKAFWQTTAPEVKLLRLSRDAGVHLLKTLGVHGTALEFATLVEDAKGHALTLTLLGGFLKRAFHGDIRQRDRVKFEKADEKMDGGHAFRTMAAYEQWLLRDGGDEGRREVALLRLMGLFDRPADAGCINALLQPPAIAGLTEPLVGLAEDDWQFCLTGLEATNLLTINRDASAIPHSALRIPHSLDAHPHLREYFAQQLRTEHPDAWREAHRRIYEYLCASTPDKPRPTLEDLQPLYQAVAHGCQAGDSREALIEVFFKRIIREKLVMRERPLGASPTDLECLSRFTDSDWGVKSSNLGKEDERFILHEVAHYLFLLSRFAESHPVFQKVVSLHEAAGKWGSAAAAARLFSDLCRESGRLDEAQRIAEVAISYARREAEDEKTQSGILRIRMNTAWLGLVHYSKGESERADALLSEAEEMEKRVNPDVGFMTSFPGWCYCERLIEDAKNEFRHTSLRSTTNLLTQLENIEARATLIRAIAEPKGLLLDVAQAELILGQVLVLRQLFDESNSTDHAVSVLSGAVEKLRRSGQLHHVAYGLARRAELNGILNRAHVAQADLDEAWEIAERGPMQLHMADIHLHRARLFFREAKYPWESPQADLAAAEKLINECGYHCRDEELSDAKAAILAT